jgi:molybdopterin-guanine dinucleotide biosynthesis protein B
MVVLIAAIGVSGSGKTTTLEYLISKLTAEGFKVGAIKHIHRENFTIDKEGTNTWRFSKAGSKVTVAVSAEEIAVIEKTKVAVSDLDRIISELERKQLDIAFIEGFHSFISKRPDVLKIVTAKTAEDLNKTLSESVPPVLAVTGLIAKTKLPPSEVPYLNLPDEGPKLLELVKEYLASVKK